MLTLFSSDHALHHPRTEMADGKLVSAVEIPSRAELIVDAVETARLGPIEPPQTIEFDTLTSVHDARYVEFLKEFWRAWLDSGRDPKVHDAFPFVWPMHGLRRITTRHLDGLMGRYSFDAGTPMGPGTWKAALSSAAVARTGALRVVEDQQPVFSLCRPPGHHAMPDAFGGYCFLNNAAIAAQTFLDAGSSRVAILDVDYHHGNGTQSIFYNRRDVLFISIHADPMDEYPYFLGHADELGAGVGEGANLNLPLPLGTGWEDYKEALALALRTVNQSGAEALVVSLGLDTYEGDPISQFRLNTLDFVKMGAAIRSVDKPTLIVLEGGYATDALASNALAFFEGYLGG
ncbi:MAG: histone deacetylase family protein [Pseudomonadota bacterium]